MLLSMSTTWFVGVVLHTLFACHCKQLILPSNMEPDIRGVLVWTIFLWPKHCALSLPNGVSEVKKSELCHGGKKVSVMSWWPHAEINGWLDVV